MLPNSSDFIIFYLEFRKFHQICQIILYKLTWGFFKYFVPEHVYNKASVEIELLELLNSDIIFKNELLKKVKKIVYVFFP